MPAGVIELDLHGANQHQAQVRIDAELRKAGRSVYRIRIIRTPDLRAVIQHAGIKTASSTGTVFKQQMRKLL